MEKQDTDKRLQEVPVSINFSKEEEKIAKFWEEINAFKESLEQSKGKKEFSFYDGPPFATGLPHYGHILAGSIKDTVTRYAHQTGHYVERRFGWDCHGLPIEFHIDKELGLKTRQAVIEYGIDNYNEKCRAIVMKYSSEWEKTVTRLGRWIDFKNDYKTMDITFMESVWWVFKQLWDKGLVYRGVKVMPFSTGCHTPLSNFEANLDYRNVQDPAIFISFPLEEDENIHLVAWTTTPWTLPSNLVLAVNSEFDYVKVKDKSKNVIYVISEQRLTELYPKKKGKKKNKKKKTSEKKDDELPYEIVGKMKGSELKGKRYVPLFNYFKDLKDKGAFQVVTADYVTNESGTGIVHCAPGFGADDYAVCLQAGIISKTFCPSPVDDNGCFTEEVSDFKGIYVKEADNAIKKAIKEKGRMVKISTIVHSYPFCWRSGTPLLYKAVPSWFVNVEKLTDKLVANNKKTNWVPSVIGTKRFHNWLSNACDWCISRNRFWGTPIPIWASDDMEEFVVVGSLAEFEELTGVKATDIHRHKIDHITIPSKQGKGKLKRIDEVFDCWFESGSMPYAQQHYPFENKEQFEKGYFPADFIAEGLDQTRGWFYTLTVLSTALFDKPAFKNVIVNGLVLAKDGKKMSKSKKNYPDPNLIIDKYGADSLRLYLVNSPVVRAESLKFKEEDVFGVLKDVFLPWFNAFRFFVENARKWERDNKTVFIFDAKNAKNSTNVMDKWILSSVNSLVAYVREEMDNYRLYSVLPRLISFIEQLTNWYIRFNRLRLKGNADEKQDEKKSNDNNDDTLNALTTLCYVLTRLTLVMAPATPFFTEYIYQRLKPVLPEELTQQSVHHVMIPQADQSFVDKQVEEKVDLMQQVIDLARSIRTTKDLPFKLPLEQLTVIHNSEEKLKQLDTLKHYLLSELNVKNVVLSSKETDFVKLTAKLNAKRCGKRLRSAIKKVKKEVELWSHERIKQFLQEKKATVCDQQLDFEDVLVVRQFTGNQLKQAASWNDNVLVVLDIEVDESLKQEYIAKTVANHVQKLRKSASLHPQDPISVYLQVPAGKLLDLLNEKLPLMKETIRKPIFISQQHDFKDFKLVKNGKKTFKCEGFSVNVTLVWNK